MLNFPHVKKIAVKASEMLRASRDKMVAAVDSARDELQSCQDDESAKDTALQRFTQQRARAGAGSRSSGRATTAQNNYRNLSASGADGSAAERKKAEEELKSAKKACSAASKKLKEQEKVLAQWDKKYRAYTTISGEHFDSFEFAVLLPYSNDSQAAFSTRGGAFYPATRNIGINSLTPKAVAPVCDGKPEPARFSTHLN